MIRSVGFGVPRTQQLPKARIPSAKPLSTSHVLSKESRTSLPSLCRNCLNPSSRYFSSSAASEAVPQTHTESAYNPVVSPHVDFKWIRDNQELLEKTIAFRKARPVDVARIVQCYERHTEINKQINALNRERKQVAAKRDMEGGKKLKETLTALDEERKQLYEEMESLALLLPNICHPSVPAEQEQVIKVVGEQRKFDFPFQDHLTLAAWSDLLDFESAAVTTGEKFYYLKNEGALLELALINWAVQKLVAKGWTPVLTPDLIRKEIADACGFQPRGEASQIYNIEGHNLCLTGTAEIPLAGMFANQVLPDAMFPKKIVGFSHAFRVEAGGRGAEPKGLYRVHQFSKVEMFGLTEGDNNKSEQLHNEMLEIEQELFSELGLHYRVLDMPGHDLGAPAYRKFDIEAWMPSRKSYGEISSTSNCLDFQSRRLNIRHKVDGQNRNVHTINGTAVAVPRVILAILENFQESDGSVAIPKPLVPYMGGITKISPRFTTVTPVHHIPHRPK